MLKHQIRTLPPLAKTAYSAMRSWTSAIHKLNQYCIDHKEATAETDVGIRMLWNKELHARKRALLLLKTLLDANDPNADIDMTIITGRPFKHF